MKASDATPDASDEALTTTQTFALVEELDSATKLIQLGVTELHARSMADDFHHLPMQLLAQGIERFLKLTVAMVELGDCGRLPAPQKMQRQFGHDLIALADQVVRSVSGSPESSRSPATRADMQFVRSNEDLRAILTVLSDFGKQGRYHRLDAFLDPLSATHDDDPYLRWERLEGQFAQREPDWSDAIGDPAGAERLQQAAASRIAYLIERLARAVARTWTLGAVPGGRSHTATLGRFLFLRDEQLGARR